MTECENFKVLESLKIYSGVKWDLSCYGPAVAPGEAKQTLKALVIIQYSVASALVLEELGLLNNLNISKTLRADYRITGHNT